MATLPHEGRTRLSLALAYAAMLALGVTLSLGPLNVIRRRPNPVSSDLRRDVGIWAALLAIGHTAVGLTVHFRGRMTLYFLAPPEQALPGPIRLDPFGMANHLGLIAAIVLAGLALISSDAALVRLGTVRWKRWQRWAYLAVGATVLHGVAYQLIEDRRAALVSALVSLSMMVLGLQWQGFRLRRKGNK